MGIHVLDAARHVHPETDELSSSAYGGTNPRSGEHHDHGIPTLGPRSNGGPGALLVANHGQRPLRHADESVEAGRGFVEAYVDYVHYVESLSLLATGNTQAHGAAPSGTVAGTHGHKQQP